MLLTKCAIWREVTRYAGQGRLLQYDGVTLGRVRACPFGRGKLLVVGRGGMSRLLTTSLSFLVVTVLYISDITVRPSVEVNDIAIRSSLFTGVTSRSPRGSLVARSGVIGTASRVVRFRRGAILSIRRLSSNSSLASCQGSITAVLPDRFPASVDPCTSKDVGRSS